MSHFGNSSSKFCPSQSCPSLRLGHSTKIHRAWRPRLCPGDVDGGGSSRFKNCDLIDVGADSHFNRSDGMANRLATARSTVKMPRRARSRHCNARGDRRTDGADRRRRRRDRRARRGKTGAPRATHRGDGAARCRRADHGDCVDQDPAGHVLRRRWLDPARAGVDRHQGTRDASRRLRRPPEGQRPPLEPL